jgi:hypothetical protein
MGGFSKLKGDSILNSMWLPGFTSALAAVNAAITGPATAAGSPPAAEAPPLLSPFLAIAEALAEAAPFSLVLTSLSTSSLLPFVIRLIRASPLPFLGDARPFSVHHAHVRFRPAWNYHSIVDEHRRVDRTAKHFTGTIVLGADFVCDPYRDDRSFRQGDRLVVVGILGTAVLARFSILWRRILWPVPTLRILRIVTERGPGVQPARHDDNRQKRQQREVNS